MSDFVALTLSESHIHPDELQKIAIGGTGLNVAFNGKEMFVFLAGEKFDAVKDGISRRIPHTVDVLFRAKDMGYEFVVFNSNKADLDPRFPSWDKFGSRIEPEGNIAPGSKLFEVGFVYPDSEQAFSHDFYMVESDLESFKVWLEDVNERGMGIPISDIYVARSIKIANGFHYNVEDMKAYILDALGTEPGIEYAWPSQDGKAASKP